MSHSRGEVLSLARALLREAHKFSSYNIRHYAKRRTLEGLRELQHETDPAVLDSAFQRGVESLEVMKRQVLIYSMYQPRTKSVMDLPLEPVQ